MAGRDAESNFELAILGYHRQQVDQYIAELRQRIADASAAFDAAVALQTRLNEANQEIARLRNTVHSAPGGRSIGDRITEILQVAEEQAAAIRAGAEREHHADQPFRRTGHRHGTRDRHR